MPSFSDCTTQKKTLTIEGRIRCNKIDLQLQPTLNGGQSFRWKKMGDNQWTGIFDHRIWTLSQTDDFLLYKVTENIVSEKQNITEVKRSEEKNDTILYEKLLRDYFRLGEDIRKLYSHWCEKDANLKEIANKFHGVRVLQQHPVENLFTFICSSNNHITRITSMVEKLCTFYGDKLAEFDGISYYDFPPVAALADPGVEEKLRQSGFGYRAKFIHQSAVKIMESGGMNWLLNLQKLPYPDAKLELMKLPGIGAKVADCICLMSLNHLEAVPVDTHVFQISLTYLPHLRSCKSVTSKVYNEIGDYFRSLYGDYAGWAHTVLFCADLKMFQNTTEKRKLATTDCKIKTKKSR